MNKSQKPEITTRAIIITLRMEGIHQWSNCPIEEVKFLRDPHRHMFHIKAWKEVTHNDRDVEIIKLKRDVQHWLWEKYGDGRGTLQFGNRSCEAIAEELIHQFDLFQCEVLEDGENGAVLST